jgi:transcription antitermination factor NusG
VDGRVGHEVYLPMATVRRRDSSVAQVPLFSSYLFIAHEPGSPWRGIRGAPGVGKLLLDGHRPQYARIGVIELLQATEEARRNPAPEPAWKPGAACTVERGPFSGHDGVIVGVRGASARVGLFVFGQLREVSMPIGNLMPRTGAI